MTPEATRQAEECKRLARAFAGAFHNNTGHEPSVSLEYRCWDEFSAAIDKLASMIPAGGLAEEARDAARYRWLREQDWFSSPLCVLRDPKRVLTNGNVIGADCPSRDRLDAAIDAILSAPTPQREQPR